MYSLLDEYRPITLPAHWDADKDCTYFEERWDPEPSYTGALWDAMSTWHEDFVRTLNRALRYFREHDAKLVLIEPTCVTPLEKIEILTEIAAQSPRTAAYRPRLLEALQACEISERERMRVLREYRHAGHQTWMYPVVTVIDYLGGAEYNLWECMTCEDRESRPYLDPPSHRTS